MMDKIQELLQELTGLKSEVRSLIDENKVEDAETKMKEVRSLEAKIALEEELAKEEERQIETKIEQRGTEGEQKTMEQRQAFINVLRGTATEEERTLVKTSTDEDGGYLVPEDEKTSINELKREYKSAKELVDVVHTTTKSGSFPVEKGGNVSELVNFDEDTSGLDEQSPKFAQVQYSVDAYGSITPISNVFLQDETGGFMAYLNRNFARRAVKTENVKIFEALKKGKTAEKVSDIAGIKTVINTKLDPAIASGATIVTNQTGFNYLDNLVDENGRGLLQTNPANATEKLLQGRVVHVFSDDELKNVAGRAPMYIGNLNEGVKFFDRGVYEVAISKEAGFNKNQTLARVIERFGVAQADKDAYVYVEIEEPAVSTD